MQNAWTQEEAQRECCVPKWSATNIQKYNLENGEFVNNQSKAEYSYGCAKCINEKCIEITWIESQTTYGGAVNIGNNWSMGSMTHQVEMKQNFLQELKEAGIVEFQWVSTASNEADMLTRNLVGPEHNKHAAKLCGHNKYYSIM